MKKKTLCLLVATILAVMVPVKKIYENSVMPPPKGREVTYHEKHFNHGTDKIPNPHMICVTRFIPRSSLFISINGWYDEEHHSYRQKADGTGEKIVIAYIERVSPLLPGPRYREHLRWFNKD